MNTNTKYVQSNHSNLTQVILTSYPPPWAHPYGFQDCFCMRDSFGRGRLSLVLQLVLSLKLAFPPDKCPGLSLSPADTLILLE